MNVAVPTDQNKNTRKQRDEEILESCQRTKKKKQKKKLWNTRVMMIPVGIYKAFLIRDGTRLYGWGTQCLIA